ncbi:MAG: AAA family ATPase [Patescibacteria group bacterium]|nr:AAA family ATPase [Patescibacteria group bacterium]
MIIGLVGPIASGKGTVVEYLVKKYSFIGFSLSLIVHQEAKKRGILSPDRETLQNLGNELRRHFGESVLMKRLIEKIRKDDFDLSKNHYVIEGIRNQDEVMVLKSFPQSIVVGIRAKRELRFQRLINRNKPWDPKTYRKFLKIDRRDLGIGEPFFGQNVKRCLLLADFFLTNNQNKDRFFEKVDKLMANLIKKFSCRT